ncbi:hypothetical protein MPER_10294, partial [Moniliophthora perniciosa FA553]
MATVHPSRMALVPQDSSFASEKRERSPPRRSYRSRSRTPPRRDEGRGRDRRERDRDSYDNRRDRRERSISIEDDKSNRRDSDRGRNGRDNRGGNRRGTPEYGDYQGPGNSRQTDNMPPPTWNNRDQNDYRGGGGGGSDWLE